LVAISCSGIIEGLTPFFFEHSGSLNGNLARLSFLGLGDSERQHAGSVAGLAIDHGDRPDQG